MDLIAGWSPVFRAPWRGWRLTEVGRRRDLDRAGTLSLRVGYCDGPRPQYTLRMQRDLKNRRRAGETVDTNEHVRSSLVPVILVDGEQVASGWGHLRLPLTPGRHLVEVQSQHSRAWKIVEIREGKTAKLDYVGMLSGMHQFYGTEQVWGRHAHLHGYTLGPRGRLHLWQYLPVNGRRRRSWNLAMIAIVLCIPLMILVRDRQMPSPFGGSVPIAGVLFSVISLCFLIWLVRVAWTATWYNYAGSESPHEVRPFGAQPVVVLDPEGPAPKPEPGQAAIVIDARFIKENLSLENLLERSPTGRRLLESGRPRLSRHRRRLDKLGEFAPVQHRFAVPPPEIILDGRPLAGSWTRMWVRLSPGRHRLEVRTPQSPLPVRGGQAASDVQSIDFTVQEGNTAGIDVTVTVDAVPDPDEPVLHGWTSRVVRLCGGPAEPIQRRLPHVDVEAFFTYLNNSNNQLATFPSQKNRAGLDWFTPGPRSSRFQRIPTPDEQISRIQATLISMKEEQDRRIAQNPKIQGTAPPFKHPRGTVPGPSDDRRS